MVNGVEYVCAHINDHHVGIFGRGSIAGSSPALRVPKVPMPSEGRRASTALAEPKKKHWSNSKALVLRHRSSRVSSSSSMLARRRLSSAGSARRLAGAEASSRSSRTGSRDGERRAREAGSGSSIAKTEPGASVMPKNITATAAPQDVSAAVAGRAVVPMTRITATPAPEDVGAAPAGRAVTTRCSQVPVVYGKPHMGI